MPLYEYQCDSCKEIFEAYRRLSDDGEEACPSCGARASRMGISLFGTRGSRSGFSFGGPSCGGGSRRSPFR